MSLPAYIRNLEYHILREFSLDRQVVLLRVLGADMRRRLPIEKDRPKHRPIHWLIPWRVQDPIKRIRGGRSVLILERQIQHGVENAGTSAERRLGAELFHHELFDRIVENSEARSNACLPRPAEQLPQSSILCAWTPRQPDARSKRFIVGRRQSNRHSFIARYNQSCGNHTSCATVIPESRKQWIVRPNLAGIDRGVLSGTIGLYLFPDISKWRIQLPPEAII